MAHKISRRSKRAERSPSVITTSLTAVAAVAPRPDLWLTAIESAGSLVPDRWWQRRPFLPIPDRRWLNFRLTTAYGNNGFFTDDAAIRKHDVIAFLEWKKTFPR